MISWLFGLGFMMSDLKAKLRNHNPIPKNVGIWRTCCQVDTWVNNAGP